MIYLFLIDFLVTASSVLFFWLPASNVLPWGIDSVLITSFTYFEAFVRIFPPMGVVLQAFVYYLLFRIGLLIIRAMLGSRSPVSN